MLNYGRNGCFVVLRSVWSLSRFIQLLNSLVIVEERKRFTLTPLWRSMSIYTSWSLLVRMVFEVYTSVLMLSRCDLPEKVNMVVSQELLLVPWSFLPSVSAQILWKMKDLRECVVSSVQGSFTRGTSTICRAAGGGPVVCCTFVERFYIPQELVRGPFCYRFCR